ncbi:hypothetical protein DOY81_009380 [Sarcophaga bullata]|nr:hypothetical protein DOY81_009380 [Sarcophaga bullata]
MAMKCANGSTSATLMNGSAYKNGTVLSNGSIANGHADLTQRKVK